MQPERRCCPSLLILLVEIRGAYTHPWPRSCPGSAEHQDNMCPTPGHTGPLLPACWLHLPQLSSAMLSSMLLLGLSCFKTHQARSCRDLHLAVSFAMPFCIAECDYCGKSRTISPGTHSLQSWGSLCSSLLQETSQSMAAFAPCHQPACPRHVLGMEGAYAKAERAQGGLPCWRPTACTEHRHKKQRENK